MSEPRLSRGALTALAALILAAPAGLSLAGIYRTNPSGLVQHRHTANYRVHNAIGGGDQVLANRAEDARINWANKLNAFTEIDMPAGSSGAHDVKLRRENFSDANAAIMWEAPYHPTSVTDVVYDSDRTQSWSGDLKQGRTCKVLGHLVGLDTAEASRDDCVESGDQHLFVSDASAQHVDAFYGPNVSASGSMFDNAGELKETRSYTFVGEGVGHAMKSVKVYLDSDPTPIAQTTQTPCAEKCTVTASFTREGAELGDGAHTVRVLAENEFGRTREQTFHLNVETHTGILRQYSFDQQELRDRATLRVNVANGNLVLEERDLAIAGTALDLRLSRFYNSLPVREAGSERTTAFGTGWSMDTAEGVEVKELASGDVRFFGPSGYAVYFRKQSGGDYNTPTGLEATLTKRGDGGFDLDLDRSEERYVFDDQGRFTEHRDTKSKQELNFQYSGGQLTKIIDTQERELDFTYTGGLLTKITDDSGREWRYEYSSGRLTRSYVFFDDGDNQTLDILGDTSYLYDAQGRLDEIIDPRETRTLINYEGTSRRVASIVREPDDATLTATTSFEYLNTPPEDCIPEDPTPQQADREGTVVTAPNGSGPESSSPDDWETTYCHDDKSRVKRVIDAVGQIQDAEWTAQSNIESYATASGAATTLEYTSGANPSRLTRAAAPGGAATTLTYGGSTASSLNPTTITDPQGKTLTYEYAGTGNTGNVKRITSSLGTHVKLEYFNAPGAQENPAPDADLEGLLKSSAYKHTESGSFHTTDYDYDGAGNLLEETPPENAQGQALQGATSYRYDQLSRVTHVIDGNGFTRRITYDHLDRPTVIEYLGACPTPRDVSTCPARSAINPQQVNEVRLTWDLNGNLDERADGRKNEGRSDQVDDWDYDALNRRTIDMLRSARATEYVYDRNGNLTTLDHVSPNGDETTYSYNELNLITAIQEPFRSGRSFAFAYNEDHELKRIDFPNGVVEELTYLTAADQNHPNDPDKAQPTYVVEKLKAWSAASDPAEDPPDIANLDYDYDEQTATSYQQDQTAVRQRVRDHLNDVTTTYDYDAISRLKEAENSGTYNRDFSYVYDLASNLESVTEGATTTEYGYNAVNELDRIETTTLPSSTYDANGNLELLQGTDYVYNLASEPERRNRTLAIDPPSGPAVELDYSGESQAERIEKDEIEFIDTVLGTSVEDLAGSGGETYYTRADTGQALGMRTNLESAAGDYYWISDPLGSTVALTEGDGERVARYRYEPYGQLDQELIDTGQTAPEIPILYGGQYLDRETGLYKQGLRYYDPTLGRWTQKDPLNLLQDPRQANRYSYAAGDPVNATDSSGAILDCPLIDIFDVCEDETDEYYYSPDTSGFFVGCGWGGFAFGVFLYPHYGGPAILAGCAGVGLAGSAF